MITLYGIPNCDTVKKARNWLENNNISYQFHDFRKDGLTQEKLEQWIQQLSWEKVLNKRSTSWRALSDETKEGMNNSLAVVEALNQPTLIKRPVLETSDTLVVGFSEKSYQELT